MVIRTFHLKNLPESFIMPADNFSDLGWRISLGLRSIEENELSDLGINSEPESLGDKRMTKEWIEIFEGG